MSQKDVRIEAQAFLREIELANGSIEKIEEIANGLVHAGIQVHRIVLPELMYAYSKYQ